MAKEFDLDDAQSKARAGMVGDFVSGDEKETMVRLRSRFFIHNIELRTTTFQGESVEQWAYQIELMDQELEDGENPELRTLALGANPYRDGLAGAMKGHIQENGVAIGPYKLIRQSDIKGRPYDFKKWAKGVDDQPVEDSPRKNSGNSSAQFRPRASE